MPLKTYLLILVLNAVQLLGQTNVFHLQNKNQLIEIGNQLAYKGYKQLTKTNDSVIVAQKQCPITQMATLLDSLRKAGYKDKAPNNITPKSMYTYNILTHNFLRVDTIYNKPDSIFTTTLQVSVSNKKYQVNQTWVYTLYSNYNIEQVKQKIKYCSNSNLQYYTTCKIYLCRIDVSIFTSLIGSYQTHQGGIYAKYQYFK